MVRSAISVYCPGPVEGFQWVVPEDAADFKVFRDFDGTPRQAEWHPIRVRLVNEDQGEVFAESDFPWLGSHALVVGERARRVLEPAIDGDAEILLLECEARPLWVINVLCVVDALDLERSRVTWLERPRRLLEIDDHAFREEPLRGARIFKIPQFLRGSTYVTNAVADASQSAGLIGINLEKVWESDRSDGAPANRS